MLEVWRQRPPKKDESGPMAIKTCREHAKLLKRFFRWLSKSDDFDWTKPHDFDELSLDIHPHEPGQVGPNHGRGAKVKTYTVEELAVLNQYAIPVERFLLLCGLNLGFKRMECATLRVGEIHLRTLHDYAKYINFEFSEEDSFVRRLRTKTEVYGEWILWPLTVQGDGVGAEPTTAPDAHHEGRRQGPGDPVFSNIACPAQRLRALVHEADRERQPEPPDHRRVDSPVESHQEGQGHGELPLAPSRVAPRHCLRLDSGGVRRGDCRCVPRPRFAAWSQQPRRVLHQQAVRQALQGVAVA